MLVNIKMYQIASVATVGADAFLGLVILPVATMLECHFFDSSLRRKFFLELVEHFLCAIATDRV